MKFFLSLLFTFVSLSLIPQNTAGLNWGKGIGSLSSDYGRDVVVDANGNVYTVGYFSGTIDCDPGPGIFTLTATTDDVFIIKLNSTGGFVWAGQIGGSGIDKALSIEIDANNDVFFIGVFNGTIDFDIGPGIYNVTSKGPKDLFVCKMTAAGTLNWVQNFGGGGSGCNARHIDLDLFGNIYITGEFYGNIDFDNGPGFDYLYSANSSDDVFTLKLNQLGNLIWVKGVGNNTTDYCVSISVDGAGSVLTTGYFSGTIDIDPNVGVYNLTSSFGFGAIFISKVDANGNLIWAKKIEGTGFNWSWSLVTDSFGNVYTAGSVTGIVDFDPGPATYTLSSVTPGYSIAYILKLDASGNFVWVKTFGGSSSNSAIFCISLDGAGNIYTTGNFQGTIDFDPNAGVYSLTSNPNTESIDIHKLDHLGNFIWVEQLVTAQSVNQILPWAITTDITGGVYIAGAFDSSIDFDPGPAINNYTTSGQFDIYIAKYCQMMTPVITANSLTTFCQGDSVILSSSSANSYSWSTGSASQNITVNSGGSYYVYVTNPNGCSSSAQSISLTVNPLPIIIANSGAICSGDSFTINPSGANTYTYSSGTNIVSPGVTTSYSVIGTSVNGCISSNTAVSSITVNPSPTITVASGAICSGGSFTIIPTGANTYTINGGNLIVTPTVTSSYSVNGTGLNGCATTTPAIITVTVISPPVNAITNASIICTGQSATLTANGANTYSWNTSSTNTTIVVSPTVNTTYTVTGTDANGCSNFSSITQSVSLCTGIVTSSGVETPQIIISPNPSSGIFSVNCNIDSDNLVIEVYNAIGQKILNQKITSENTSIDLSRYAKGIYYLKIIGADKQEVFKLIKE